MFVARAGLNTRRNEGQSGLTALLAPKKKSGNQKFYCWVPCMLGPCIGGLIGLVILLGGAAMCTTGYYAKHFASTPASNGSHIMTQVDKSKEFHMRNMTFVGPVIMGCGCFVIIIACVVVCEQRDKDIRIKAEKEKLEGSKKNKKKKEFYNAVLNRLKKSQVYNNTLQAKKDGGSSNKGQKVKKPKSPAKKFKLMPCLEPEESEVPDESRTQQYSHISDALRTIPRGIFSVDLEQREGSTLLPIRVKSEEHIRTSDLSPDQRQCHLHKYSSDGCLGDMAKAKETSATDGELFNQKPTQRSLSDLCVAHAKQTETCDKDGPDKPDTLSRVKVSKVESQSHSPHPTGDSVVITIDDKHGPSASYSADKSVLSQPKPAQHNRDRKIDPIPRQIQCQVSIHSEQTSSSECKPDDSMTKSDDSKAKPVDSTTKPDSLTIAQHQGREDKQGDDNCVDTDVLAITSGIARANAAGMDFFLTRKPKMALQKDDTQKQKKQPPTKKEPLCVSKCSGTILSDRKDSEESARSEVQGINTTEPIEQHKHGNERSKCPESYSVDCQYASNDSSIEQVNSFGIEGKEEDKTGDSVRNIHSNRLNSSSSDHPLENSLPFASKQDHACDTSNTCDSQTVTKDKMQDNRKGSKSKSRSTTPRSSRSVLRLDSCDTIQTELDFHDDDVDDGRGRCVTETTPAKKEKAVAKTAVSKSGDGETEPRCYEGQSKTNDRTCVDSNEEITPKEDRDTAKVNVVKQSDGGIVKAQDSVEEVDTMVSVEI